MAIKRQGLGRGLEALLTATREANQSPSLPDPSQSSDQNFLELDVTKLVPGKYQPRREILPEDLEALADSIRAQGVIQPILVRPISSSQYEIIAGERRWRAAQLAGLTTIPAVIKTVEDETALAMGIIENIQRENLNPMEEAFALERLSKEFRLTHIQVAEAIGKSRTTVTNLLRLLTLVEDVKLLLERGEIEIGHAKVLLGLRGHQQSQIAKMVVAKGLSVRETENLVAKRTDKTDPKIQRRQTLDPNIRRLQDTLSEKLCASVEIVNGQQGKGKLVIHYNSLDELDGILDHIQ